jgi:hypothetical protein
MLKITTAAAPTTNTPSNASAAITLFRRSID